MRKIALIVSIMAIPCSIGLIIMEGPTYIFNLISAICFTIVFSRDSY